MFRRTVGLTLVIVLLLSGACLAIEKPFGDFSNTQQAINKLFTGRTLDPVEGIWVRDEKAVIGIVKSSIAYPDPKQQKYDYLVIKVEGKWQNLGELFEGLNRTKYNFLFKGTVVYWKLLSPNLLECGVQYDYPGSPGETYVRVYPAP